MNPGDLRVAKESCGLCHGEIVRDVDHSMMTHGAMLWGAALYNNGAYPEKNYRFGQAYGADGAPLKLINLYAGHAGGHPVYTVFCRLSSRYRAFNLSNPGNILRIFEKGGRPQLIARLPTSAEPTENRIAVVGAPSWHAQSHRSSLSRLQKTRLHDPLLGISRSNDHPGDYRSSGCSACHVFMRTTARRRIPDGGANTGIKALSFHR